MTKARSLADFRAAHDRNVIVPAKIKAALAALLKIGPEHYEYESDFMKLAGVSQTDIGQFRDQFEEYFVETPAKHGKNSKRAYFGSPRAATAARGSR